MASKMFLAKIVNMSGLVEIRGINGVIRQAVLGEILALGEVILTTSISQVELLLSNNESIKLDSNESIFISQNINDVQIDEDGIEISELLNQSNATKDITETSAGIDAYQSFFSHLDSQITLKTEEDQISLDSALSSAERLDDSFFGTSISVAPQQRQQSTDNAITVNVTNRNILFDANANIIDGGNDHTIHTSTRDCLIFSNNEDLDFNNIPDTMIKNFEKLDLTINGDHTLNNITLNDVLQMTDKNNTLSIMGDTANDKVFFNSGEGWNKTTSTNGYDLYSNFNDASVKVFVATIIDDQII